MSLTLLISYLECCILAFWRSDKLRQIAPLLVEQVSVCIRLGVVEGKVVLSSCLDALMEVVNDDSLIKSINLDLLMHTRAEDVRMRLYALSCSESLWRTHGGKLLGQLSASCIPACPNSVYLQVSSQRQQPS